MEDEERKKLGKRGREGDRWRGKEREKEFRRKRKGTKEGKGGVRGR